MQPAGSQAWAALTSSATTTGEQHFPSCCAVHPFVPWGLLAPRIELEIIVFTPSRLAFRRERVTPPAAPSLVVTDRFVHRRAMRHLVPCPCLTTMTQLHAPRFDGTARYHEKQAVSADLPSGAAAEKARSEARRRRGPGTGRPHRPSEVP